MTTSWGILTYLVACVLLVSGVLAIPLQDLVQECPISMDEEDKVHKYFAYNITATGDKARCTICNEETRMYRQVALDSEEVQCKSRYTDEQERGFIYNMFPMCRDMISITCHVPEQVTNGKWLCPCSGVGNIPDDQMLVYTDCTLSCDPGFQLAGNSSAHCGQIVPLSPNLTMLRYTGGQGPAWCILRIPQESGITIREILFIVGGIIGVSCLVLVVICICQRTSSIPCVLACWSGRCKSSTTQSNSGIELTTRSISDTGSGSCLTQTTRFTQGEEGTAVERQKLMDKAGTMKGDTSTSVEFLSLFYELLSDASVGGHCMSIDTAGDNVTCKTYINSLCDRLDLEPVFLSLDKKDDNADRCRSYYMVLDILKSILKPDDFQTRETVLRDELHHICNKTEAGYSPSKQIFHCHLKVFPCMIGHVVMWCVDKGYQSLVPHLVSTDHEQECQHCKLLKKHAVISAGQEAGTT